jgi:hypothetical protein
VTNLVAFATEEEHVMKYCEYCTYLLWREGGGPMQPCLSPGASDAGVTCLEEHRAPLSGVSTEKWAVTASDLRSCRVQ